MAFVLTGCTFDVAVVGAGLCGLECASSLAAAGLSVGLVEATGHAGGRIRSVRDEQTREWLGDLGPTWVWPEFQFGLKAHLDNLGLSLFLQQGDHNTLVDVQADQSPVLQSLPVQSGQYRISGGTSRIIEQQLERLTAVKQYYNRPIESIEIDNDGCRLISSNGRDSISSTFLVVATPPRIACDLKWQPGLDPSLRQALENTPTWMASQAKVVLLYDKAFWRSEGLSGRIISRVGPLVELHDHSGLSGTPASLTGFLGIDHASRQAAADDLGAMINEQLERLFGSDAPKPVQIIMKDWAGDRFIATELDLASPMEHPTVQPRILREPAFDNRVWFASAESAASSPGLIAGAFDAAVEISNQVIAAVGKSVAE